MHLTSTTLNESLYDSLAWLLKNGQRTHSRNGSTLEATMVSLQITQPWNREVLLPDRKASLPAQIFETAWVLAGRDDIKSLERYLPRARDFSDDGETWRGAYGPRIRNQIPYVARVLTEQPDSRQAVISIYNPAVDSTSVPVLDRPCNLALQFLLRGGELHCNVFLRSNDAIWGYSGINVFEWSVLQEIIAGLLGVGVGCLQLNTTSFHLYDRHLNRAKRILKRGPVVEDQASSPRFWAGAVGSVHQLGSLLDLWFEAEQLIRGNPYNRSELREVILNFPEPMFRSWLQVLAFHWSGDPSHLAGLEGTRLYEAAQLSPPVKRSPDTSDPMSTFADEVTTLHDRKHAAYGDSWKRRGEVLGILANVDRKIDRLEADDETESALDTAIDLFVYAAKWSRWLDEPNDDGTEAVNEAIRSISRFPVPIRPEASIIAEIRTLGAKLDCLVPDGGGHEDEVRELRWLAGELARQRWASVRGDSYGGADRD